VRDWLGFIKRIIASEESFKIDWLLFELLKSCPRVSVVPVKVQHCTPFRGFRLCG
jgi:hypothetical protein